MKIISFISYFKNLKNNTLKISFFYEFLAIFLFSFLYLLTEIVIFKLLSIFSFCFSIFLVFIIHFHFKMNIAIFERDHKVVFIILNACMTFIALLLLHITIFFLNKPVNTLADSFIVATLAFFSCFSIVFSFAIKLIYIYDYILLKKINIFKTKVINTYKVLNFDTSDLFLCFDCYYGFKNPYCKIYYKNTHLELGEPDIFIDDFQTDIYKITDYIKKYDVDFNALIGSEDHINVMKMIYI